MVADREACHRWAELLRRIFEIEPLACPRCGQTRRIVAFITEPKAIDRILDHLRRTTTALACWFHGEEWLVTRVWWSLELIADWAKSGPVRVPPIPYGRITRVMPSAMR